MSNTPVDAFLLLSFGGPEGRDDVMPFLRNVTRGRNVPDERLLAVAEHYYHFDGISPINELNRKLLAALEESFKENGVDLPIYWGNRNWAPMLVDTVQQMKADGIKRAVAVATSAYSSYSSCRQYIEDVEKARAAVGEGAPEIDKLPPFWSEPGFMEANEKRLRSALTAVGDDPQLVFTAHSIPTAMAEKCDYASELNRLATELAQKLGMTKYDVAYQSRSGPASQPWLEPDVCDYIREKSAAGEREVVVHPIGFVADHMEVLFDLDVEAAELSDELGVKMVRASTAGTHPAFVQMITELVKRHVETPKPAPLCAPGCCPSGR